MIKRKKAYSNYKKITSIKRKRKKTIDETGSELICGDPNIYLKDQMYLTDQSADVHWEEIRKCKVDLQKHYEKSNKFGLEMSQQVKTEEECNTQPKAYLNNLEEIPEANMIPATAPLYILDLEKEDSNTKEENNIQKLSIKQEIDQAKNTVNIEFEMIDDSQNNKFDPIVLGDTKIGLNREEIKNDIRDVGPIDLNADPYDLPPSD